MRDLPGESVWREQRQRLVGVVGAHCGDENLAEDIVHDALVRAIENWDDVRTMDAPNMWLRRVAMNLTSSHYRRRRTERRIREQLASPGDWAVDGDPTVRLALVRALETLPARQRAAVALRYLLDWSVADVAELLGTTEGNVKVLTHRGVVKLRSYFERADPAWPSNSRRNIVTGLALVVVAAAAAVALAVSGRAAAPVYIDPPPQVDEQASWTGDALLERCPSSGRPTITLHEGGNVFALHVDGGRFWTCYVGDAFWEPGRRVELSGSLGTFDPATQTVRVDGLGGGLSTHGAGSDRPTYLHGRIGDDVDRAIVVMEDTSHVDAAISDGHFAAMWDTARRPLNVRAIATDGAVLAEVPLDDWLGAPPTGDSGDILDGTPPVR